MYKPIACRLYDYIEIACLRGYTLHLELEDGSELIARAESTRIHNGAEFLVCRVLPGPAEGTERGMKPSEIRLDRILFLTPLEKEAEFGRIALQDNQTD